jgi:hypothetical protein
MNCINTKHVDFIKLQEESKIRPLILEFVIKDWQAKNDSPAFPTVEQARAEYRIWNKKSNTKAPQAEAITQHPASFNVDLQLEGKFDKNEIKSKLQKEGSASTQFMLDLLFKHIGDDLNVEVVETLVDPRGKEVNGDYDAENNVIKVSRNSHNIEGTLVHELVHAATVKILEAYRKGLLTRKENQIVVNLEALFNKYKRAFPNDGTQASHNLEEFVSGIFTDARVQRNADSIKYRKDRMGILETFFMQLMDFFGFGNNNNTLLSSGLYNTMFLLESLQTDVSNVPVTTIYNELSQEQYDILTSQYNDDRITLVQKEVAERLLTESEQYTLSDNEEHYIHSSGKKHMRVGDWYQRQPGYSFTGDEAKFARNRAWGNQLDLVLEGILLEKTLSEINADIDTLLMGIPYATEEFALTEEVIDETYTYFSNWVKEQKDAGLILLPQITVGNKNPIRDEDGDAVAGSLDIVTIDADGKVDIIDLKSSIHATQNDKDDKYNRDYGESKSTRKRHSMQLGGYKGILYAMGLLVGDTYIFPARLTKVVDPLTGDLLDEIDGVEFEDMLPVIADKDAVRRLSKDGMHESTYNASKGYDTLLDDILTLLKDKTVELKNNGKRFFWVETLMEELNQKEPILAIEHFINNTHTQYYGPDNKQFKGYLDRMVTITNNKKLTPGEKLTELEEIQEIVLMYERSLQQLKTNYSNLILDGEITADAKDYSSLKKLGDLIHSYNSIELDLNHSLAPLQSQILSEATREDFAPETKEQIAKMYKILAVRKAEHERATKDGKSPKTLNRQKFDLLKLQEDINKLIDSSDVSQKGLQATLQKGERQDIGFMEFYLRPFISSSSKLVATVARKIKTEFEKARLITWSEGVTFTAAFEKFLKSTNVSRDNVVEFNKKFFTKVKIGNEDGQEIKDHYLFESNINWAKYQESKLAEQKLIRNLSPAQQRKAMKDWYKMNTKPLQNETLYITNPETGAKTIYMKGKDQLIEEMEATLTKKEFSYWLNKSASDSTFSLPADVYANDMGLNVAEQKYYDTLMYYMFEANNELPNRGIMYKLQLPSITKNSNDRVRENGVKDYASYNYTDATEEVEDDIEIYGDRNLSIPILYRQAMPIEDISVDLGSSVMRFFAASQNYKAKKGMHSLIKSVYNNAKAAKPGIAAEPGLVKSFISKQAGIDRAETIEGGGLIAQAIKQMLDIHIYGKTVNKATVGTKDINKMTNTFMGIQSITTIGGNPILSLANGLMGNVANLIESAAGKHFNKKNWVKSLGIYESNEGNFMSDFSSPMSKSQLGQIIDVYDALQGDFNDKFGRKMTMSAARKAWSLDSWFFLQHKTEHQVQSTSLIAKLLSTKVTTNGVESNMYDAYEQVDGKIRIKDGTKFKGRDISGEIMISEIQQDIHAVNKDLQGVYNSFDKPMLEKFWWGKLLMMYRKFIVPGFIRRYGKMRIDYESSELKEGTYRTFHRLLMKEFKELGKFLIPGKRNSELTSLEKANVRRTVMDMGIMFTLTLLLMLLAAATGGDDREKERQNRALYYLYYPLYRLRSEVSFFWNPLDFARVFKTPTIAYSMVEKVLRVFSQMFDPFETYTRAQGVANKGDYKFPHRLIKLLGINGYNLHPDEALKVFKMHTN